MQSQIDALLERIQRMNKDASSVGITTDLNLVGHELDTCDKCKRERRDCTCQNHAQVW
jgi:hypothetical protein